MLEIIRQHSRGWLAWVLVGLIALGFVSWGMGSYFASGGTEEVVAKINDKKITAQQVQEQYERLLHQSQISDQSKLSGFEEVFFQRQALDSLINTEILVQAAEKSGLVITPDQVRNVILSVPDFQEDGRFSLERYHELLRIFNYSDSRYRNDTRDLLLINQMQAGIQGSAFVLEQDLNNIVRLLNQKRDIGYAVIAASGFKDKVDLVEEELKIYYEENPNLFTTAEKVKLNYIELSLNEIMGLIKPTNEELKRYYERYQNNFKSPEQNRAAHIFIRVADGANKAASNRAEEKIKNILARINKDESFEKLATMYSEDLSTAKKGGDLGWFTQEEMEPGFNEAVSKLQKKGDISDVVATSFGYHIIKLLDRKAETIKSFAEVESVVLAQYKQQQAELELAEKVEQLADLAFENPTSLQQVAIELGISVKTTGFMGKEGGEEAITKNSSVIQAAFSEDVLQNRNNSEVIEAAPETYVVVRIAEHVPSTLLQFDEVKTRIKNILTRDAIITKAKQFGEKIIVEVANDANVLKDIIAKNNLTWQRQQLTRSNQEADQGIVSFAFAMPYRDMTTASANVSVADTDANLLNINGTTLASGDYVIIGLFAVEDGKAEDLDDKQRESYRNGIKATYSELDYQLYSSGSREKAKVTRKNIVQDVNFKRTL